MFRVPTLCVESLPPKFARSAEIISGRTAMAGVVAHAGTRILLRAHIHDPHLVLGATGLSGLISLGSLITMHERLDQIPDGGPPYDITTGWTPSAEMINGRLAILAMAELLSVSSVTSMG